MKQPYVSTMKFWRAVLLLCISRRSLHMLCSLLGVLSLFPHFGFQCRKDSTQKRILSANSLDLHSNATGSGAVSLVLIHYMYKLHNYVKLSPCEQVICMFMSSVSGTLHLLFLLLKRRYSRRSVWLPPSHHAGIRSIFNFYREIFYNLK